MIYKPVNLSEYPRSAKGKSTRGEKRSCSLSAQSPPASERANAWLIVGQEEAKRGLSRGTRLPRELPGPLRKDTPGLE